MKSLPLCFVLLAACGGSKENKEICKKAGDRYLTCVGEILGPEMQQMAAKNDGTAMCARDDKTVAMYKTCLPSATCSEFMDCITDYAEGKAPKVSSNKPRAEQCKEHVDNGIRGIANQIMMLGELAKRDDAEKRTAQECLLAEKRPWQDCLEVPEIKEVDGYAKQRMEDCLAWDDNRAACAFKQGGTDCDELEMWEAPVVKGAAGPAIEWQASVTDDLEDYDNHVQMAWTPNKTLVIRDDASLRALREGKELWSMPLTDSHEDFALAGQYVVLRENGGKPALHVIDAHTGAKLGQALVDIPLERHGAAGDKVLVQLDDDQLFEIDPSKCKGTKSPKGCATRLGQLTTDDTVYSANIASIGDVVVMTSSEGVHVADRKAATLHTISSDKIETTIPTSDGVAVVYDTRIELHRFATCSKGEDCVTARHKMSWINTVDPTALPGGAIAFNDHGVMEKTTFVDFDGKTWSANTHGFDGVGGDREHVYTVALGRNEKEPARLLALSRANGQVVWQTELAGVANEAKNIAVVVQGGKLAVRVDKKLFVVLVGTKT